MYAVAANPNLLVNLKALLDDGLLTAEEFQQQKRKLLKSDAPATVAEPGEWKETMQELVKAQRDVASVLSSLAANPDLQGTDMGAFKRSREDSVWTTPDQPTLFTVGVKKVIGKKSNARGAVHEGRWVPQMSSMQLRNFEAWPSRPTHENPHQAQWRESEHRIAVHQCDLRRGEGEAQ